MSSVIGLISTNYTGEHYGKLIEDRPVASIPFGGRYRLIDFTLSSMANSEIGTVGVITPSNYRSLADHLNMGREWGLNKKQGGMFLLPGAVHGLKDLHARFSLRDVILNREFFLRADEDVVLFCAANRVYNIDFQPAIAQHEKSGAPVTLIYKKVRSGDTAHGLFLDLSGSGTVTGIHATASGEANCFLDSMLINRKLVLDFIECYQNLGYIDIMDILATSLGQIQVNSWCYGGYEHAVDNAEDYMHVSLDLLRPEVQGGTVCRGPSGAHQDAGFSSGKISARRQCEKLPGGCQLHSGGYGGELHPVPQRRDRQGRRGAEFRFDAALHHWRGRCGGECDLR